MRNFRGKSIPDAVQQWMRNGWHDWWRFSACKIHILLHLRSDSLYLSTCIAIKVAPYKTY